MTTAEAAEALELYITTSDRGTLEAAYFAFRHVSRAVDHAAYTLAKQRAQWHDDPHADDHAEFHAHWQEQFGTEARAAVVMALFERCERVRKENLLNALAEGRQ